MLRADSLTLRQFEDFGAVISRRLGIRMPESKRLMLQNRLCRRAHVLGLATAADYHAWFFAGGGERPEELPHLLDVATTNKTSFFREPDHFDHLVQHAVPTWRAGPHGRSGRFRVWCAGCATGEEAYTLAIVLRELHAAGGPDFSILATDVCTSALETARAAIYDTEDVAPVPEPLRRRHVLRSRDPAGRRVRIAPEVRQHVRFGHLNFLSPDYGLPEPVHLVFFRNVLIYFERETQIAVLTSICRHLLPGGLLYLSHSESTQNLGLPLATVGASVFRYEGGLT